MLRSLFFELFQVKVRRIRDVLKRELASKYQKRHVRFVYLGPEYIPLVFLAMPTADLLVARVFSSSSVVSRFWKFWSHLQGGGV